LQTPEGADRAAAEKTSVSRYIGVFLIKKVSETRRTKVRGVTQGEGALLEKKRVLATMGIRPGNSPQRRSKQIRCVCGTRFDYSAIALPDRNGKFYNDYIKKIDDLRMQVPSSSGYTTQMLNVDATGCYPKLPLNLNTL